METHRVYLRALEPDDFHTSVQWRRDDEIWSGLCGTKYFVSESYEKQWVEDAIRDSDKIRLAVCLKENNQYVGNVYITDIDTTTRSGVSHILIGNKDYWGKGIASEAYNLLLDYAFKERGMHRIVAHVLEDNVASIALHKKCGYTQEGIARKAVFKGGRWKDQIVFSILDEEFFNNNV